MTVAYTYHTVQSATRALNLVERTLAETRLALKAEETRTNRRGVPLRSPLRKTVDRLEHRRDFLAGELEKARENERLGIRPQGPETTMERRAREARERAR